MYIDVHAHLTDGCFDDLDSTMPAFLQAGVGLIIVSGYDLQSSQKAKALAEKFPSVYFSVGFQPQELNKYCEGDLEEIRRLSRHEKCLAIGEIGLDYHYEDNPEKELQKDIFIKQIALAYEEKLPIVVHSRDCAEDTLTLLKESREYLKYGGVMHCYSYSAEMVKAFEALGFYFSFGGTSTYKTARKVHRSAQAVRVDRILTETDCPYLTPEPLRGQFPNTPKNIPYILNNLALLRGMEAEALRTQILKNAQTLFTKLPR